MTSELHPTFVEAIRSLADRHPSLTFGGSERFDADGTMYRIHAGPGEWPVCDSGWCPTPKTAAKSMQYELEAHAK